MAVVHEPQLPPPPEADPEAGGMPRPEVCAPDRRPPQAQFSRLAAAPRGGAASLWHARAQAAERVQREAPRRAALWSNAMQHVGNTLETLNLCVSRGDRAAAALQQALEAALAAERAALRHLQECTTVLDEALTAEGQTAVALGLDDSRAADAADVVAAGCAAVCERLVAVADLPSGAARVSAVAAAMARGYRVDARALLGDLRSLQQDLDRSGAGAAGAVADFDEAMSALQRSAAGAAAEPVADLWLHEWRCVCHWLAQGDLAVSVQPALDGLTERVRALEGRRLLAAQSTLSKYAEAQAWAWGVYESGEWEDSVGEPGPEGVGDSVGEPGEPGPEGVGDSVGEPGEPGPDEEEAADEPDQPDGAEDEEEDDEPPRTDERTPTDDEAVSETKSEYATTDDEELEDVDLVSGCLQSSLVRRCETVEVHCGQGVWRRMVVVVTAGGWAHVFDFETPAEIMGEPVQSLALAALAVQRAKDHVEVVEREQSVFQRLSMASAVRLALRFAGEEEAEGWAKALLGGG